MTPGEYLDRESRRLKSEAETGDFRAVAEAFALFAVNKAPLPEWLIDAVWIGLFEAFKKGGADKRGKTGGHEARARRLDIERERYIAASNQLLMRKLRRPMETRKDAFEAASRKLAGTVAQGSAGAIEASYNRAKRRLHNRA